MINIANAMHSDCPECAELGVSAPLYKREQLESIDHHVEPFRDEKGSLHVHDDVNEYVDVYVCSLGHELRVQCTGRPCWCSWLPTELQQRRDADDLEAFGIVTSDSVPD